MSKVLFLLGCIPTRIFLTYLAFKYPNNLILSLLTFIIGTGFFYIYITGSRKIGIETEGKPIWWNNLRPFHGTFYLIFSILNLVNIKNAWIFLAIDTLFGLTAFLNNYYF
jgi:hypothetical protein